VDKCVGELLAVIKEIGGIAVVTSDHGNADEMFTIDKKGAKSVKTAHTLNPVPLSFMTRCIRVNTGWRISKKKVCPILRRLLNLLGYEKPEDYDPSLIEIVSTGN